MTNKIQFLEKFNYAKQYSQDVYAKTKKYQRKYGFELGDGKSDTWNNEADAFKHTFGAAEIALKTCTGLSKGITDFHELQQRNNPTYEEDDIIADRVMSKMKAGKLITNPYTDTRKFNDTKFMNLIFNTKNRIFHKGENISIKDLDYPIMMDTFLDQALEYTPMPTKATLDDKIHTGELIYVSEYIREDGTKVSGYYRSYPEI